MRYDATYSPEDNKLRLYASTRLDAETYARVKAAGFKWAPKQDLFVAPMWTPAREDLLIELAGEIGDEDTSLVDRAEQRADRFDTYREKRTADAESARKAVAAIADHIPFGQPILVGHHSEKHARRDAERIENGMRKAVRMWETAGYWKARAAGALRHAKYKELPQVRARRIKTIEADKRRVERELAKSAAETANWRKVLQINDPETQRKAAVHIANTSGHWSMCFPLDKYPRNPPASQYEGAMGLWSAITGDVITPTQAAELAIRAHERYEPRAARWIAHYENRLTYERAMLEEAGASDLLAPKPRNNGRAKLPLLNYRATGGSITTKNEYDRSRDITYSQVDMTAAEYSAINKDYKGTRLGADKAHRFRTAMVKSSLVCVFLTDSKAHPEPKPPTPPAPPTPEPADDPETELRKIWDEKGVPAERQDQLIADIEAKAQPGAQVGPFTLGEPATAPAPSQDDLFAAMKQTLKAGVQVVSAPQLFPTPLDLAARVVELADIPTGAKVLEPSAGTGNLAIAASRAQGVVTCIEISPPIAEQLRQIDKRGPYFYAVHCADFLECNGDLGTFDRVVMNPPFERGADIQHIEHARKFVKPGGRLVAICANGPRQRERLMPLATHWEDLPAGTFKAQGTAVNTALLVIDC